MVYQRNKKAKGDPPISTTIKKGLQEKSGHLPGPTGPATGQSGVVAGQPGGNRAPKEEPAVPVCARSTGLSTGGSGAPSGPPGGNRAPTGRQPEELQDQQKASGLWPGQTGLSAGLSGLWPGQTGFVEEKLRWQVTTAIFRRTL